MEMRVESKKNNNKKRNGTNCINSLMRDAKKEIEKNGLKYKRRKGKCYYIAFFFLLVSWMFKGSMLWYII
jgi:hypothetical protein